MDPLTGLSLAVNIIQLLDVAKRIVSEAYAVSKSPDGITNENREALDIASDIETLVHSLQRSQTDWLDEHKGSELDVNERALQSLCANCQDVAQELVTRLKRLKPRGKLHGMAMIRTSLLLVWKKDEIERYTARLQAYREELNTRLLNGIRVQLTLIDKEHDARFTSLDARTKAIAFAIVDHRDVFLEELGQQRTLLEDIKCYQEQIHTLVAALTPTPSSTPTPMETTPTSRGANSITSKEYPLHDAAKTGDVKILRNLLASSTVDVNAVNDHGSRALHIAQNTDVARRLIKASADINAENFVGQTPLMVAIQDRRLGVVDLLISQHAELAIQDDAGNTALDYAVECPTATYLLNIAQSAEKPDGRRKDQVASLEDRDAGLRRMAWLGDVEGVKFFLANGAKVDSRNNDGSTALHDACHDGSLEVVMLLLDAGANMELANQKRWKPLLLANLARRTRVVEELIKRGANIEAESPLGRTVLAAACSKSHWSIAQTLIDHGARVAVQDNAGNSPLHFAIQKNANKDFIMLLLAKGALLDVRNALGITPLICASMMGNAEKVQILLSAGAKTDISSNDGDGFTPLLYALRPSSTGVAKDLLVNRRSLHEATLPSGPIPSQQDNYSEADSIERLDVVRLLIEHKANPNVVDSAGRSALHLAALYHNLNSGILGVLLSAGGLIEAMDMDQATPLGLASFNGHTDAVRHLLDAGANINSVSHNLNDPKSDTGYTPLMLSVIGRFSSEKATITSILAGRKANLDAKTAVVGATALLLSIQSNAFESALVLMESGANVDLADAKDSTPLIEAVKAKEINVAKTLLEHGAKPDLTNTDQQSPTWLAVQSGAVDMLKILLDHGANANFTHNESTLLMAAAEAKAIDVVQVLLDYGASQSLRDKDGCTAWIRAKHACTDKALKHLLDPKVIRARASREPHG